MASVRLWRLGLLRQGKELVEFSLGGMRSRRAGGLCLEMLDYAGLLWGTDGREQDRQQREWGGTSAWVLDTAGWLVSGWKAASRWRWSQL